MNQTQYYEIDIIQLLRALWRRLWIVLLTATIFAGAGFTYAAFFVPPEYQAEVLMYVNNTSFSLGSTSFSISDSQLNAAQSLVDTYIVILKTRTTLNAVIEDANLDCSYEELSNMISSSPINSTEVFNVKVTCGDPVEAEEIANSIANILPKKIADIVEGSSVRIVDYAIIPGSRVSPNITKKAMLGFMLGALLASGVIIVLTLLDSKIHDEDYLIETYDLPVFAVVPDLGRKESKTGYGYYGARNVTDEEGK